MTNEGITDRTIPAVPFLAELREAVLERTTKRMPKWRLRLAPDLLAQIQPKPALVLSQQAFYAGRRQTKIKFECRVIMSEEADPAMLEKAPKINTPWWLRRFEITDIADDIWELRDCGGMCKRNADHHGFDLLADRFRQALASGLSERVAATRYFSPHCVLCGKALTDPASMARFIGPECANSSTLNASPWLQAKVAA